VAAWERDRNHPARQLAAEVEVLLAHHGAGDVLACAACALFRSRPLSFRTP
jgi:hypothetical protein